MRFSETSGRLTRELAVNQKEYRSIRLQTSRLARKPLFSKRFLIDNTSNDMKMAMIDAESLMSHELFIMLFLVSW